MKKSICTITTLILLLALCFSTLAESKYVSIDTPIVVPEVDIVPIVRITWNGPAESLDESLEIIRSTRDELTIVSHDYHGATRKWAKMEDGIVFDSSLPWDDAPNIAINTLRQYVPSLKDMQLTCYFKAAYGDSETNGEYYLHFYSTFHGIPFLVGNGFRMGTDGERGANQKEEECPIPLNKVQTYFKTTDQFGAVIYPSKEVGVDMEDVPLLSFDEILKVLEQRVTDGYVHSLNEVRFGYMVFIDPKKKGEECVLMPIWAAKGRTNGDLNIPFDLKTSDEVLDAAGYTNLDIIVINAQTGEPYELYYNTRPDRRYVPDIITWDDVK